MIPTEFAPVDADGIRSTLGEPVPLAVAKIIDHLDENCRAFLAHSPFCCLATADAAGNCDCSPRGDYPGFVRAIDRRVLAIPDRVGNRMADSMRNIAETGRIGLLSFVPGMSETLRINGTARVTSDPDLLTMLEQDGTRPELAIVVHTEQVYLHCGRALVRSGLWDPEMQDLAAEVPTAGRMWATMSGSDDATADATADAIDGASAGWYRDLY